MTERSFRNRNIWRGNGKKRTGTLLLRRLISNFFFILGGGVEGKLSINKNREIQGGIHSTKISVNFGPKLNGSVRSNRKSFENTGQKKFEVDFFSRSDRSEFLLNGSRPQSPLSFNTGPPPARPSHPFATQVPMGQQLFFGINNMADLISPLVSFTTITPFRGIISCLVLSVAYVASLYVLKSPYPRLVSYKIFFLFQFRSNLIKESFC